MLELEIKKLTAAITRLADLMEQADDDCEIVVVDVVEGKVVSTNGNEVITPTKFERAPDVEPVDEKVEVIPEAHDYTAMRQQAQDACLETVRANRENKATIGNWLAEHDAKTIKQLGDEHLPAFIAFLEWLIK
jgi:hypothetical protein